MILRELISMDCMHCLFHISTATRRHVGITATRRRQHVASTPSRHVSHTSAYVALRTPTCVAKIIGIERRISTRKRPTALKPSGVFWRVWCWRLAVGVSINPHGADVH